MEYSKYKIVEEFKNLIPPLTSEEYSLLERSIIEDGVRDPLTIYGDFMIVDGHNRFDIAKKHNLKFKTVNREFKNMDEIKIWIIENQLGRRNISNFVRSELALEMKHIYAGQAKERQSVGGKDKLVQNSAQPKTRDIVAKLADVSHDTINKVERIKEKATEEQLSQLRNGKVSINEVHNEIKKTTNQLERMSKRVERDNSFKEVPLPDRKYGVLYVDPPWEYEHSKTHSREVENHYPTMTLDKIKSIDIDKVADNDCIMFMWTTSPKLTESIEVLEAWNFLYRTCAVWVKDKIGMGYYFRQQHELLLVATKGSPVLPGPSDRVSSVLSYPRGKHSAKPIEIYDTIDSMYPNIVKFEMFSRGNDRKDWENWGFESNE